MPKPFRASLARRPHAVVFLEWFPHCRPVRDFEGFDVWEDAVALFDDWCEDCRDAKDPIVIAEVIDTSTLELGRVAWFGEDATRRADQIRMDPTLLLARRQPKVRANVSWVTDQVATGGDFSYLDDVMVEQLEDLLAQDIGLIVDCRVEADDAELWASAVRRYEKVPDYLHLPTDDVDGWTIPPEHFEAAVAAAGPRLARGERVLVHCHMGVNRGPSTAYAVLLAQGFGVTEAFDLIRSVRPIAGIAYAEDALRWWAGREGWDDATWQHSLHTLRAHTEQVLGPAETRVIDRAIRKAAEKSQREVAEIVW